jgi:hypothetical protein
MLDIAAKMRELIPVLHEGINGVELPDVEPETEEEWSADYAIVFNVYHCQDDHYFDEEQFWVDVIDVVVAHFTAPDEKSVVMAYRDTLDHQPGTIVITFWGTACKEIEVYRCKSKANLSVEEEAIPVGKSEP